MTWKTHLIGGAQAGVIVGFAANGTYAETALVVSAALLGSVLPDIDQPGSKLARADSLVGTVSFIVSKFTKHRGFTHTILGSFVIAALFYALAMVQGGSEGSLIAFFSAYLVFIFLHGTGGPLKAIAGWLAIAAYIFSPRLLLFLSENDMSLSVDKRAAFLCAMGIFAGCLSHMVYDSANKGGVAWLWPLSGKKIKMLSIKTNTIGELWFIAFQIVVLGLLAVFFGFKMISF